MIRLRFPLFFAADDGVNIPVRLTLEGDPNAAPAAIEKVKEATEEATAATKEQTTAIEEQTAATEKLNKTVPANPKNRAYGAQMDAEAAAAMGSTKEDAGEAARAAAEERRNSLISQRMAIEEAETELLAAQAANETRKVAELTAEVQIRSEALALQRATLISEEEATAVATQRFHARATALAQEAMQESLNQRLVAQEEQKLALEKAQVIAQEELNAQLVEEEVLRQKNEEATGKVYGGKGRAASELRNFGMDANAAAVGGLGVMGGMQAYQFIEDITRKQNEITINAERATAELEKQKRVWQEMASVATDMQDLTKLSQSISERVSGLQEKLRETPGESGLFDNIIGGAQMARGWMDKLADSIGPAGEALKALNDITGLNGLASIGTSTQNAMDEVSESMRANAAAGAVAEAQAKKNVEAFQEIERQPLPERIDSLIDKMKELTDQQDAVDRSTAKGVQRYNELSGEFEKYSKALEKAMGASGAEQEKAAKREEYEDKIGQKLDEQMHKEAEKFTRQQASLEVAQQELAILQAQARGEDDKAKALENELRMQREIKTLTDAGVPQKQAQEIAQQTRAARDQIDQRKQAEQDAADAKRDNDKQTKITDQEQLERDKARHNQRAVERDERKKFEDDRRKQLEDANFSPEDVQKHLDDDLGTYDKAHRGNRIDGRAPMAKPKSGLDDINSPSAPLDPNDTLRRGEHGPSDDFAGLGGHMQKSQASADMQRLEKGNPQGAGADKSGADQKQAADTQKAAAEKQSSAGEKQSGAAEKMSSAAEKMSSAAEKMAAAAASMASKTTGTPSDDSSSTLGPVSES